MSHTWTCDCKFNQQSTQKPYSLFQLISNNGTTHRVMNKHPLPYTKTHILTAAPSKHGARRTVDICLLFRLSGTKRRLCFSQGGFLQRSWVPCWPGERHGAVIKDRVRRMFVRCSVLISVSSTPEVVTSNGHLMRSMLHWKRGTNNRAGL